VSLRVASAVAATFTWARQYDKAIEQFRKTLEMDPDYFFARILLGAVYIVTGRYEEAITECQKALTIAGNATYALAVLGWAYGRSGQKDEALDVLDRLEGLSKERYVPFLHKALIYLGIGELDRAAALGEKGYLKREQQLVWLRHPLNDPYRSHPGFMKLSKKMGLED